MGLDSTHRWTGTTALAALLVVITTPAFAQQGRLSGLDRYIEQALSDWEVPGLAVSIVKDDSIIFARGYGVTEIGTGNRVDEHTTFAIGSASKAFTSASVAMLVDKGDVDWDDKVTQHLPGFQAFDPYVSREMTVRDLLTHRSGLSRGDMLWYGSDLSRDEIVHRVRFLEPSWSFRSQFGYQNLMYLTAGEIVEELSGMTWDDFVTQRIFTPLGMRNSNTSTRDLHGVSNLAAPHAKIDGEVIPINWRNIDNVAAAGSINSNVIDMAQWLRLQLGEGEYDGTRLVDAGPAKEMHTPQTVIRREGFWGLISSGSHFLNYGMGWFLQDYRDRLVVHHGGNIDGMSALITMMPEEELGIAILTNLNGTAVTVAVMNRIYDMMLDGADKDWSAELLASIKTLEEQGEERQRKVEESRVAGTSPSLDLAAYVGQYTNEMYGDAEVTLQSGTLSLQYGAAFLGELEHWHYDTFRAVWQDRTLGKSMARFTLGNDGKVSEISVANIADFRRVPDDAQTSAGGSGQGWQN